MNILETSLAVQAICPIHGISTDGRVDYIGTPTVVQRQQVAAIMAQLDPNAPVLPRYISKLVVIDRLQAAGLFDKAFAALGGPGKLLYERWSAASEVDTKDPEVRGLLQAIGADVNATLMPPPEPGTVVASAPAAPIAVAAVTKAIKA